MTTGLATVNPGQRALTTMELCDRCGVRARVRAVLARGGELCFCTHHAREYYPRLKPIASVIEGIFDSE